MEKRLKLSEKLHELLNSDEVHFQPPESIKLHYPCIIYDFDGYQQTQADNGRYVIREKYMVTHIYRDPEESIRRGFLNSFLFVSHNRHFIADNLYHDVFIVYL